MIYIRVDKGNFLFVFFHETLGTQNKGSKNVSRIRKNKKYDILFISYCVVHQNNENCF